MQNAIKANEADSMFRLYSCSFGIACQKWHHDAAGCQKDSHLRVPNTQMAHIVAREELIDRSFYPLETSRNPKNKLSLSFRAREARPKCLALAWGK